MLTAIILASLIQGSPTVLTIDSTKVIRTFDPSVAFGAGLDGHEKGENSFIFSPKSVAAMKSAGFHRFTYRLRTELAGEAWHWNPKGTWSDPTHERGYWVSDSKPGKAINVSYGYRLPRRGNTIDQANNDDYSRIDDGDIKTFWKSNPYLDPTYGGEPYASRPQWIVVDLGQARPVDTIIVRWGNPFASEFEFQYWDGPASPYAETGNWRAFTASKITPASSVSTKLQFQQLTAQYVRLLLKKSKFSAQEAQGSTDRRDRLGFAIHEIQIGHVNPQGEFEDWVDHAKNHDNQSIVYVSSTDPWHRKQDIDTTVEQPGFDLFFKSKLIRGNSALMSTSALYDTPENVAAQVRWLKARGYPLAGFEIGEEPDGQVAPAENFAELYIQMANQIRRSYPKIEIGGPSFQTVTLEFRMFPGQEMPWIGRFVDFLRVRKRLQDFAFCSFEWYPFDDVNVNPSTQLPDAVPMLTEAVDRLKTSGMGEIPWIITEYGFSAFGGEAEVDLPGAIFNLDCALSTIRLGGRSSYLYGLEPNELIQEKPPGWGNNMMFMKARNNEPMPIFFAAKMLLQAFSSHGTYRMLGCDGESPTLGCYPVQRPDGALVIALINRSPSPASVQMSGLPAQIWVKTEYSPNQYKWHADKDNGRPALNLPPKSSPFKGTNLNLPGDSITILCPNPR